MNKKEIKKDCACVCNLNKPNSLPKQDCKSCKGTGEIEDSIYYIIDNKNNICFDSDNPGT